MRPFTSFRLSILPLLCCKALLSTASPQVLDLGVLPWTLSNLDKNISVPAQVPSQAHLDLLAAGVIPDPYYGQGDTELRWVAYSNWTYEVNLGQSLDTSNQTTTWLLFNGLDTFTSISFCGQHVAATNNQFRQYYFDISSILSLCTEEQLLTIDFGSAVNITADIASQPGQETWPSHVEIQYEFPNRQFMRKEQSDFGWDWGPAFAPAGPWQPAYVIQQADYEVHVRNSILDIHREGQLNNLPPNQNAPWILDVGIDVLGSLPSGSAVTVQITDLNNETVADHVLENVTISKESIASTSSISGSVKLDKGDFELWWPNGLGAQNLYNFTIAIHHHNQTLAKIRKRSGFRTIVLNMEPISDSQLAQGIAAGNNWHFEVNGHEFYAKGSNFIPPDAFWPRVTDQRIKRLFQSVVDGNQNMLRVWASGAYSPDFLYDLADEMGILLWSEFEFGDALYPVDSEFLENVREEVTYNVRRVNHHPSLALWAGGNELENLELLLADTYDPGNPIWKQQYEQLFLDLILPIVYNETRSISYIPSSTTNGYLTLNFSLPIPMIERYDNATPGSIYGDTDHYDYDSSQAFNLSSYPIGRFANEFGFHSMPSLQTWQQVTPPSDLFFNSTTVLSHNHHYPPSATYLDTTNFSQALKGQAEMTIAVERFYPVPALSDSVANFASWCWTTQLFQAEYYRSQIAYYRRGSGLPERQLGSLYWQLEDIWQAATWAGIEYDGRWKVLHYVAKDIYQPVIIAAYADYSTGNLTAYVTSDLWTEANGTASWTWYDYSGSELIPQTTVDFTVGPLNTTQVLALNTTTLPFSIDAAILKLNITATGSLPNSPSSSAPTIFHHESIFHSESLAETKFDDPGLELGWNAETEKYTVTATKAVAAFVWLEMPAGVEGRFETNAFWLLPGDGTREVGFLGTEGKLEKVENATVRSLWDNLGE